VTNYQQAAKLDAVYDLVILDESHNYISGFPKKSKTWAAVKKLCAAVPLIYISATPNAQGYHLLYHQLALSSWSPWSQWTSSYKWFEEWGVPKSIWIGGRAIQQYDTVRPACFDTVSHLFITKTRKEIGFEQEPEDIVHHVELGERTKEVYNRITKDSAINLNGRDLVCDSIMKLRTSLHMLEGGVAKIGDEYLVLGNTEKIEYIKKLWGDSENMVIMYNYIAEGTKLKDSFKKATVLQGTSFAEGIDLSSYDHLVIYSQDFSTARHTQRRARQANKERKTPIKVHFLLVRKAISSEVYKAVSVNKQNYVDKLYNATRI